MFERREVGPHRRQMHRPFELFLAPGAHHHVVAQRFAEQPRPCEV